MSLLAYLIVEMNQKIVVVGRKGTICLPLPIITKRDKWVDTFVKLTTATDIPMCHSCGSQKRHGITRFLRTTQATSFGFISDFI